MFMQKAALGAKRVHIVHWNKSNPMFRIDNTDNIIDVNAGNLRWEYDQANFICPVTRSAAQDDNGSEKYIIYNVSKEEYDMCMVTKPSSRIVATCTDPSQLLYFTITFRSFTPTPGGLEFHPGKDYYFISTSSPQDLYRRDGGRCVSHNMKVMFKVANISNTAATKSASNNLKESSESVSVVNKPRITTLKPQIHLDDKHKYYPVVDDNDVETSEIDANTLESAKKVVRDFQNHRRRSYTDSTSNSAENEVVKQEASRMHSSATTTTVTSKTLLMMASILMNLMISKKN